MLEEDAHTHVAFWEAVDLSALKTMPLPFAHAAPPRLPAHAAAPFAPQRLVVPLQASLQAQVHTLAQQHGVSPEVVLLACWHVLLWRLNNGQASLLGVQCAGRPYEELSAALGPYSRVVPLALALSASHSFARVLTLVHTAQHHLHRHQAYFSWERRSQALPGEAAFLPLAFEYETWPSRWSTQDMQLTLLRRWGCSEPFILKCSAVQVGQHLAIELHYEPSSLGPPQMQRLAHSLQTLWRCLLLHPQQPIGRWPLMSQDEQRRLQEQLRGSAPAAGMASVLQCFERQVEQRPEQLALCDEQEQLSYRQLNERATGLAQRLRRQGVGPNVLVGVYLERSAAMLVGVLAIWKAGGAYVALESQQPRRRLLGLLEEAAPRCVLTQEGLLGHLAGWSGRRLCLDGDAGEWAEESQSLGPTGASGQDLAYVLYTSGSTGRPKGVMIRQQSVSHYTQQLLAELQVEAGWHFASVSTLAADLGNTAIFGAWASGGCVHVLSYATVTSGEAFGRYLAQQPLDVLKIVPSHLSALLESAPAGVRVVPRRFLILGGEALRAGLVGRVREQGGGCEVINHYGPTEMTIGVLVKRGVEAWGEEEEQGGGVALGRALGDTQVYILDGSEQWMPVGVTGELYLGGAGLAVGYLGQAEQTAERFVPDGFTGEAGGRLYRTGDRVRCSEEGQIEYVGRTDRQVKVRGYRIELGEIEAVLNEHSQVRESVVQLREDEGGQARLVAYVVSRQAAGARGGWRDFLEERLPGYMVPAVFVGMEHLPLTSNGKLDWQRLPVPDQNEDVKLKTVIRPRDEVELRLLRIWEDVLKVQPINVFDNFFYLGGHSILAVRLISRMQMQFGQDIVMSMLFQNPTIAKLAVVLRQKTIPPESWSALVTLQPNGSKPPFFCIHPSGGTVFCYINLARYLGSDQPFYGLRAYDLIGVGEAFNKLEGMAARYIDAIQTVQPRGPYLLGGWSSGGVVAFEMAQQLLRQGHSVALLALFDSKVPATSIDSDSVNEKPDIDDGTLARMVLEAANIRVNEDFQQLKPEEQFRYAWEQAKSVNIIPLDTDLELLRRIVTMQQVNIYAVRSYVPQVYPHRITFFQATGSPNNADANALSDNAYAQSQTVSGWEELATEGIEMHLISGKHSEMIEEPNVQVLAASLKRCIDATFL